MSGATSECDFAFWSRALGIVGGALNIFFGITNIDTLEAAMWCLFTGFIIGCVELPICCQCADCCKTMVRYMKFMEARRDNPKGGAIRGIVYLSLSLVGLLMIKMAGTLLLAQLVVMFDGIFYIAAFYQGAKDVCRECCGGGACCGDRSTGGETDSRAAAPRGNAPSRPSAPMSSQANDPENPWAGGGGSSSMAAAMGDDGGDDPVDNDPNPWRQSKAKSQSRPAHDVPAALTDNPWG